MAAATDLREGPEGVRAILTGVARAGSIPLRDLCRRTRMPVPVVSAVRRELEKRGLLVRSAGLALSDVGRGLVGVARDASSGSLCPACAGDGIVIPGDALPLLDRLRALASARPAADASLDQSHATAETALRRALYLRECDALGRDLIFLGDDDLVSLAVGLLRKHAGDGGAMAVVEVDPRLVGYLREVSGREGFDIVIHPQDLRDPLPGALGARFDAFATDPPYTQEGLKLFVRRGVSALRKGGGRQAFIAFGPKSPDEQRRAVETITDAGLGIVEMRPTFNRYDGAQLLGGVSAMVRAVTTSHTPPELGRYEGPVYTAQMRKAGGSRQ